ncbi:MAG: NAD(P)/FAD-dependent oxidoreductase [Actinobacteria bacterium]|nr:NAD(P)/FAD-dependent oxidoreductase [Actinomycetota bacterium]
MQIDPTPEPIVEDDDAIRAAVADADVHALLIAVAHCTGDLSILRDDLQPDPEAMLLVPDGGLSPERVAEGRAIAAAALAQYRDAGSPPAPVPTTDDLRAMFDFLIGAPAPEEYFTLLREELAVEGDLRAPDWHKDDVAPDVEFSVAIIGSGMSGLIAAHRLHQAGIDFVVFEKNEDVGGTWWENTYPGCRVDVPNHLYSYSFAQTGDWPQFFSSQEVLLDYFRTCADRFGLREHVRFCTEVTRVEFEDADQTWQVYTRDAGGKVTTEVFNAVVSAVGQLNRPSMPAIEGTDSFAGEWFHSARWRDDISLDGKRVAVIGTGASAVQFIPHVAERAERLFVFQRTPPWLVPSEKYAEDLPDGMRWVLRHVPSYARWDRLWLFWRTHEGLLPMAKVDPNWPDQERSVSESNDMIRQLLTGYLQLSVPDAEVFEKILPAYPPIAKRVVFDNGTWGKTLLRDNVELIADRIDEINEKGIRTVDGTQHDVDVVIYGTGFQASKFLTPMKVTGLGGIDLHESWDGDARAYLGITVPGFPNLFLLYGPNTNIVINGSIVYFSECEVHYLIQSIRMLLEHNLESMECKSDVHDAYNERVDAGNRAMAWGASSVNSWYKNASGRVAQNWPFSMLEYWQQTRTPDPDDYVLR